ncbi:amino acid ABC transporter permease [Brevifollis gellanilyticus]|uniref:Amino acid ABC transporter permease n=1 Tax=Brevifollis gellanilyticus TaxID=748831 RepID=A0A512M7F6_9BACT|nr:amino acid ABC transporter permease [Brevifollis gellanilyticus]GEP42670.1 amino acid ABC transporter permease [Brevifollis gellanilyticus]
MPGSPLLSRLLWSLVLLLGVSLALYGTFATVHYSWHWSVVWGYRAQFLWGWVATMVISLGAMVISMLLGFALMLGRRSPWEPVRLFCSGTVEIVRGSPLLVQLLIGYYIVATALHVNSPVLVGTILLGLFEAAYLAEIFRGAVESIGASQWEAARAVGFNTQQTYRHVIIPQAVRRALPGTTGELVSLIKSSSLLSVIGIEELVQKVRVMNSASYTALEGYLPLAVAYLIVTLPLSWWARRLERRFAYET